MASAPRCADLLPGYLLGHCCNYCLGCNMKQVTIDTVRERIAELEMVYSHGELSLRGEFELACLRELVALMDAKTECAHVWMARPIDGSNSAEAICEAACKFCGARPSPATDNTAQQFEALATSGKSEHLLNAERIAMEVKALPDRLNDTSAVHPRVSGWSEHQQKVIAYSLWRFSYTAHQQANQAAQTNNKDMFDRFIRDARCAEEIREEFTSAWGCKP